jgi:peptidoglycan/LPS O-acetylase OafA/YrhL
MTLTVLGILGAGTLRMALFTMLSPSPLASVVTANCLATRGDALLAGCLVGMLACWNKLPKSPRSRRSLSSAASVLTAGLIVVWIGTPYGAAYLYYGGSTLIAVAMAIVIAALVTSPPRLLSRLLTNGALVWVGQLSYGLYLWHYPMWTFVTRLTYKFMPDINTHGTASYWPFQLIMTFVLAVISFYCVEQPFLRLKDRLAQRRVTHPEHNVAARAA